MKYAVLRQSGGKLWSMRWRNLDWQSDWPIIDPSSEPRSIWSHQFKCGMYSQRQHVPNLNFRLPKHPESRGHTLNMVNGTHARSSSVLPILVKTVPYLHILYHWSLGGFTTIEWVPVTYTTTIARHNELNRIRSCNVNVR